ETCQYRSVTGLVSSTAMDSFSDRLHDPLLFLNSDKSDLDAFLMNTSSDMVHMGEEMHGNISDMKMDNSLDLDSLEGHGHLGDMNWLHNSSLSNLAHLDSDDTSDGNLISVNPQSVLPIHIIHNESTQNLLSSETANSAAMRLHANCSNLLNSPEADSPQHSQVSSHESILGQDHQTICILSVASQNNLHNSPAKTQNFLITSSRDSPHKSQTFVLSTAHGGCPGGLTITTASSPMGSQFVLSPQKVHAVTKEKSGRVLLKSGNNFLSPSQASPVLLGRLQTGVQSQVFPNSQIAPSMISSMTQMQHSDSTVVSSTTNTEERTYPKPVFSYSCLIALALKNSKDGNLPVSEIYSFMCENFPYFKTAPDGWKNSVRHNLSLNKCFAKVDNPKLSQGAKKGCLWALNPAKVTKMEDEITKWGKKDPAGLLSSMAYPENLEAIEKGQAGLHYSKQKAQDFTPCTPNKADGTPMKVDLSRIQQTADCSPQIRIERYNTHSHMERSDMGTPMKVEFSPTVVRDISHVFRQDYSTPNSKHQMFAKIDHTDLSFLEVPVSLNNDALADIVLQSSVWDDLENNIDIDLICDLPSSHSAQSSHSPLTARSSPNPSQYAQSSGNYSPSVHPFYRNVLNNSPVQHVSPSAAAVRTSLFGTSTPTRRTLYA
ncbi:unnamed protein product, partial [Candidula unifasciata]